VSHWVNLRSHVNNEYARYEVRRIKIATVSIWELDAREIEAIFTSETFDEPLVREILSRDHDRVHKWGLHQCWINPEQNLFCAVVSSPDFEFVPPHSLPKRVMPLKNRFSIIDDFDNWFYRERELSEVRLHAA